MVCDARGAGKEKEHLFVIDHDDQLVYEGPSSGMPLFARLGLLDTVEVSESAHAHAAPKFASHASGALGIVGAVKASSDFFELCLERCPAELMVELVNIHVNAPVFFPLLHAPSFLAEFTAVTERRLRCTPQYGAFLMSLLACTVRLASPARALLPPSALGPAVGAWRALAFDLLRLSTNKLDVRHILALYHLALLSEGEAASADVVAGGAHASLVAGGVGLALATGLHRSAAEFAMDPVTAQLRARLFWAFFALDTALAYSHGRPALIRLSECSVDLPAVVDNDLITKTKILAQDPARPPVAMAAAVAQLEISIVLVQVLAAINAPSATCLRKLAIDPPVPPRSERLRQARKRLDGIERSLPPYLLHDIAASDAATPDLHLVHSARVGSALRFVRTLIARQAMIEDMDAATPGDAGVKAAAAALSVATITTYARLRALDLLGLCGFPAVSHLTAAAHTLVACMLRAPLLPPRVPPAAPAAPEHRAHLLTAIDLLADFADRYPCAHAVGQLLVHLARRVDAAGDASASEAVAIRVLARKMAPSPHEAPAPPPPHAHIAVQPTATSSAPDAAAPDAVDPDAVASGWAGHGPSSQDDWPTRPRVGMPHPTVAQVAGGFVNGESSAEAWVCPPLDMGAHNPYFAPDGSVDASLEALPPGPHHLSIVLGAVATGVRDTRAEMPGSGATQEYGAAPDSNVQGWGGNFMFLNDGLFDNF
ncbi:hypothetical protein Q5752_003835 [Cryptotrichosporon argae]